MRLFKLTIIAILLTSTHQVYSQASWTFFVWFHLYDKNGKEITKNNYLKRGVKLYSLPFGAHSNNHLTFDTVHQSFKFSQHTVVNGSRLVFVLETDTTVIDLSTTNIYISKLNIKNAVYTLKPWINKEKFNYKPIEKSFTSAYFNKFDFSQYKTREIIGQEIKELIEVKFEQ